MQYQPQRNPVVLPIDTVADLPPLPDVTLQRGTVAQCQNSNESFYLAVVNSVQVWRSAAGTAFENFILYLDETGGNDANDGLTPSTAIQTLDEAALRWPGFRVGKARPIFAPGAYSLSDPDAVWTISQAVSPNKAHEGEAWIGGWTAVPDCAGLVNTIDAPGGDVITVTGPLPAGLRGSFVRFDSGDNLGIWLSVRTNDATTITLDHSAPNDIPVDAVVSVMRPNVQITLASGIRGATGDQIGDGNGISGVTFQGIEFVGAPAFHSCYANVDRCTIDTQGGTCSTQDYARFNVGLGPDGFDPLTFDAQLYVHGTDGGGVGGSFVVQRSSQFSGSMISDDTLRYCDESSFDLFGFNSTNSPVLATGPASVVALNFGSINDVDVASSWNYFDNVIGLSSALLAQKGAFVDANTVFLDNNTCGDAVVAAEHASVNARDVHGTGNAGVGLVAGQHGCVLWDPGDTDVAGLGGELLLGSLPYTYAAVEALTAPYVLDMANGVYSGAASITDPQGNILGAAL